MQLKADGGGGWISLLGFFRADCALRMTAVLW
jgi:hypothetical protein